LVVFWVFTFFLAIYGLSVGDIILEGLNMNLLQLR
jgi:hypothetical protein